MTEPLRDPSARGRAAPAIARLGPADAAIFETFVVPRYLSLYGELALEMMAEGDDAQVVHLHCRTGYPDRGIVTKLRGAYVVGVDASPAALALARAKAATMPEMVSQYRLADELPTPLPASAFSHALELHGAADPSERTRVIAECARLLAIHGQAIIAMPLRGSFQEIADLLREYALKHDDASLGHAVDQAALARPTIETLASELQEAGFDFVEGLSRPAVLRFSSGRDFFEDPIARLIIVPELSAELELEDLGPPLSYVRTAIDKYWSDDEFELTVNVGCVTGRREG
ncbi:MAG TPA: methyltransferase domain-containing protein [Polyangiaceae bacterium]|nr:methyltransferase domain-containing protein [Polyangiaceae bacterium]